MTVRTRVAPSPTGDPHLGTGYVALFNLVFARRYGGQFILRIEDTDAKRSSASSEQQILDSLRWLGLDWDEGPDCGGPHGPYRQSERSAIYKEHAQQLLDSKHAFRCYCTSERLTELRQAQQAESRTPGYDGHCLHISDAERIEHERAGTESVVRMIVPSEGVCLVQDLLRGEIEIPWVQVDMQVLLKADGLPTYHLANVVDDHMMEISHVFRGEEWLNSAPKHQLLYKYFGWQSPQLAHLPLLRNPDKSKLSKRKNPTSIRFYERLGYLPEAVLNYLGRMGWSMPDERERFSLAEMIEHFDYTRISLGGPIFDQTKLRWLNSVWIRETLSLEQLSFRIQQWAINAEYMQPMLTDAKQRIEVFSDLAPLLQFYFAGDLQLQASDFEDCAGTQDELKADLQLVLWTLEGLARWQKETVMPVFKGLATYRERKLKVTMVPFFIAITGQASSVPVMDAMVLLGPDVSRYRLRAAIDVLGGLSKKGLKQVDKQRSEFEKLLETAAV